MLKKIKLIAAIFLLLFPSMAWASNEPALLTVWLRSGAKYDFKLSELPVITFDAKQLYINADDFSAVYDDVESICFTDTVETAIDNIEKEEDTPRVLVSFTDGHRVMLSGCGQTVRYAVYSVDGRKVSVDAERTADGILLDFGRLIPGIYVININSQSFKIRTR